MYAYDIMLITIMIIRMTIIITSSCCVYYCHCGEDLPAELAALTRLQVIHS